MAQVAATAVATAGTLSSLFVFYHAADDQADDNGQHCYDDHVDHTDLSFPLFRSLKDQFIRFLIRTKELVQDAGQQRHRYRSDYLRSLDE